MSILKRLLGDDIVVSPAGSAPQSTQGGTQAQAGDVARVVSAGGSEDLSSRLAGASDLELAEWAVEGKHANLRLAAVQALLASESVANDSALWERIAKSAQSKDRRVFKLARERAQALAATARANERARQLAGLYREMSQTGVLDIKRLIESDHALDALKASAGAEALAEVETARAALAEQLTADQVLQREVAAIGRDADKLTSELMAGENDSDIEAAVLAQASLAEKLHDIDPARVPETLFSRTQRSLAACEAVLQLAIERRAQQAEQAEQAREAALAKEPEPSAVSAAVPKLVDNKDIDALKALIAEVEAELVGGQAKAVLKSKRVFLDARSRLGRLPPDWRARFHAAEIEVLRLEGFARDKAGTRRDELMEQATKIAQSPLPAEQIAAEIRDLHAQWKAIDEEAGAAGRKVWERFHAVTSMAYERVRAQRKVEARAREDNAKSKHAMLTELDALLAQLPSPLRPDAPAPDWKALAAARGALLRRWFEVGPVNRSESKTLRTQFDERMRVLDAALEAERASERAVREALIAKVEDALASARTQAPDALVAAMRSAQDAQKAWTGRRTSVTLGHKEEQLQWERFRAVCDEIFGLRDQKRAAEKAAAQAKQAGALALLAEAETLSQSKDAGAIEARISALDAAWKVQEGGASNRRDAQTSGRAGAQDRRGRAPAARGGRSGETAQESGSRVDPTLAKRFDAAIRRAREAAAAVRETAKRDAWIDLLALDMTLCEIDSARAEGQPPEALDARIADAQRLALGQDVRLKRHAGLAARARRAVQSDNAGDPPFALALDSLTKGSETRAQLLLDLELALGLDSPAELAAQRRGRQLLLLAARFKSRSANVEPRELLEQYLGTAALPDESQRVRLQRVVAQLDA